MAARCGPGLGTGLRLDATDRQKGQQNDYDEVTKYKKDRTDAGVTDGMIRDKRGENTKELQGES